MAETEQGIVPIMNDDNPSPEMIQLINTCQQRLKQLETTYNNLCSDGEIQDFLFLNNQYIPWSNFSVKGIKNFMQILHKILDDIKIILSQLKQNHKNRYRVYANNTNTTKHRLADNIAYFRYMRQRIEEALSDRHLLCPQSFINDIHEISTEFYKLARYIAKSYPKVNIFELNQFLAAVKYLSNPSSYYTNLQKLSLKLLQLVTQLQTSTSKLNEYGILTDEYEILKNKNEVSLLSHCKDMIKQIYDTFNDLSRQNSKYTDLHDLLLDILPLVQQLQTETRKLNECGILTDEYEIDRNLILIKDENEANLSSNCKKIIKQIHDILYDYNNHHVDKRSQALYAAFMDKVFPQYSYIYRSK